MEATAKCVPLTSKEKDNIINPDNEWETEIW
jgi:hypothetical protein